jgi:anti-sigma B factor antagonist
VTEKATFEIERSKEGEVNLLVLTGELDVAAAPELHEVLLQEIRAGGRTVLDLAGVTFVDSVGLSVLVTALHRATERNADLSFCALTSWVARVLEISGLDKVFSIYDTRQGALSAAGDVKD